MLFDVLFLMVLPAIFMLLSLSRSACICPRTIVRYVRTGRLICPRTNVRYCTFEQDGEPRTNSLSQGQSAWIGRLLLNQGALDVSTFECL